LKEGKPPLVDGDGLQTRDFIHAIDVAEFVRKVLVKEGVSGQVFNCGSGSSTSILDLAKTTITAAGKEIAPEFGPPRKGDIRHSLAEVTKAWTLVGFSPRISLRDGIAELLK
jgi:UDP-glucose 4-epimerase